MAGVDLFSKFGGTRPMARALRIEHHSKVHGWKMARRIPSKWVPRVLEAAHALNLEVTAEDVIFPFPEDRTAH